ncbi:hypothetical protein EHF33_15890 [Deinococcus psychrotolerans]|uniref:Lipoprotein n=1 Tax=Deinococcus psychrotolerans TaxID=2489213 RepID=A0A3G8YGE1_9DEIO|nr:hypothetical protein [Deinococcus psychrotolerans]AZI44362.1 hypothetical protein EHF33_15890 [Deinococcus psychrotolerans]
MKKNLGLLALTGVIALAACSAPLPVPTRTDPPTKAEPVVVTYPAATPAPAPLSVTVIGNPTSTSAPYLYVTALEAGRSPGNGAGCTAMASEGEDKSMTIRAANCGETSTATVYVALAGQTTPQKVGEQDLILVQKRAGIVEPVSAVITVRGEVVWPK